MAKIYSINGELLTLKQASDKLWYYLIKEWATPLLLFNISQQVKQESYRSSRCQ